MEPKTPEQLLDALTLAEENAPTYKTVIGITAEEITENAQDRANLAKALENQNILAAASQTATQIKNAVFNGDKTESVAVYPAVAIDPLPFPDALAGALKRWRKRRERWMSASGYTKEIGIALGIAKPDSAPASPGTLTAALKPADLGGYQYEVDYKKQGRSGMHIEHRVKGTEKFTTKINSLKSPVKIDVEEQPASEGAAIQLEIRGRLLDGNEQVGQWSPIYTLTVNP
jgi:hypothetical protein